MRENGIAVRQQDGLRIGFVVADDAGYAFNLPPLLVEDVTEMSRTFNAHVERHTAQLPQDLVFATRDAETQRRVKASFRVVDGDSTLGREAKGIADRVNALRSLYLRSVGSIGSVMLRSKHEPFVKEIEKIRQEIDHFRASAEARLQKEIDKARQKLVDALLPAVMRTPPQDLVTQVSGKPTSEVTRQLGDAASWPPPRSVELAQLLFKAVGRRRGCNRLLHDRQAGSQRCPKRLSRRVQLGHSG